MINFDEGTALMEMMDMLKVMLSEAERDFDHAIDQTLAITKDPNASWYQIQTASEKQISASARYDAIAEANKKALNIYNNMICEAAGLPYFN